MLKEKKDSFRKLAIFCVLGIVLLLLLIGFSLTKGSVEVSFQTIWESFFHFNGKDTYHLIIIDNRLPRIIASALVGAAFAVSGAIMQGVTRNPMADSGLMGLNSGAAFALAICFAFLPGRSYWETIVFSFLGAVLGGALVYGVASFRKGKTTSGNIVLAGMAVSALLVALSQGVALYFNVSQDIMYWTVGGVAGTDWSQLAVLAPLLGIGFIGAIFLSPSISILSFGDEMAKGLGVNTKRVQFFCWLFVLLLTGVAVSVVGSVALVGLMIPHIMRYFVGGDYRFIIPGAAVLGAILMVLADLGARTLNPPFEVPLGALIALVGVPFFIYLARKERRVE